MLEWGHLHWACYHLPGQSCIVRLCIPAKAIQWVNNIFILYCALQKCSGYYMVVPQHQRPACSRNASHGANVKQMWQNAGEAAWSHTGGKCSQTEREGWIHPLKRHFFLLMMTVQKLLLYPITKERAQWCKYSCVSFMCRSTAWNGHPYSSFIPASYPHLVLIYPT